MKWLSEKGCPIYNSRIFAKAAKYGSLLNMKWLLEKGCPINDPRIFEKAAGNGCLKNMQWLFENGCPMDEEAMNVVFYGTQVNIQNIKWLLEKGCPIKKEDESYKMTFHILPLFTGFFKKIVFGFSNYKVFFSN